MDLADLIQNAEAHVQRLAERDYHREGVEMILALEHLSADYSREEVYTKEADPLEPIGRDNALLAQAVQEVAARLSQVETPTRSLQLALEATAFYDFRYLIRVETETDPPTPVPSAHPETTRVVQAIRSGRFIRSVNFHNTFAEDRDALRAQLRALDERFKSVGLTELDDLIAGEPWTDERAPILLVFYEGTRNHFDVAAPLLEELGLTGVFCLIPGFTDTPPEEQVSFATRRSIDVNPREYAGGRVAMTWDEVRQLALASHAFVCHTMTHSDLDNDLDEQGVWLESAGAVKRLEEELGEVNAFVWRRGGPWGVLPRADAYLQRAGIRLLLSNFSVTRLPLA